MALGGGCKLPDSKWPCNIDGVINTVEEKQLCHEIPFFNTDAGRSGGNMP